MVVNFVVGFFYLFVGKEVNRLVILMLKLIFLEFSVYGYVFL